MQQRSFARLTIQTARLTLVSATLELAQAAVAGNAELAAALKAAVPAAWPPSAMAGPQQFAADRLEHDAPPLGWGTWYWLLRETWGGATLAGCGGFNGVPDTGEVEVHYVVLDAYQRRGIATEATQVLASWALFDAAVHRVVAHTYPDLVASIRVLEKSGFLQVGAGPEGPVRPGVPTLRFERSRL